MMFLRRFWPASRITAHAWTLAKAAQFAAKGFGLEARALLAGSFGLPAPAAVRARLSPATLHRIFGTTPSAKGTADV